MRLPRDVTGDALAKALKAFGYQIVRQTGGHLRLTTSHSGEHHITVPSHDPLKIGLFAAILDDVAGHFGITRDELLTKLKI